MEKAPEKKRVKIDTRSYVSGGHGGTTIDLKRNPEADDEEWFTPETEKPTSTTQNKISQPAKEEKTPDVKTPPRSKFLVNLIRKDIEKHKQAYIHRLDIETYVVPKAKRLSVFRDMELFKNYKENKEIIKRKIIEESKTICAEIKQEKPDIIDIIIDNEDFVIKKLNTIMIEKLKIKNIQKNHDRLRELSLGFVNVFRSTPP